MLVFVEVTNMSWARAVWIENDVEEEGVVPRVWIEDKTVRWPKGINVIRAFSERRLPLDNWLSFPLLKIKVTSGLFLQFFQYLHLFINILITVFLFHCIEDRKVCEDYEFTTSAETSDEENVINVGRGKEHGSDSNKNSSTGLCNLSLQFSS